MERALLGVCTEKIMKKNTTEITPKNKLIAPTKARELSPDELTTVAGGGYGDLLKNKAKPAGYGDL
jgi:hypothetical protein